MPYASLADMENKQCQCGSGQSFKECCQKYLNYSEEAPSAEKLMRSRYCAFVLKDFAYLKKTHDIQTYDPQLEKANEEWANAVQFECLTILKTEESGNKGMVEFKVSYQENGESKSHHEISRFRKQAGRWFYKEGRYPKS